MAGDAVQFREYRVIGKIYCILRGNVRSELVK